MAGFNKVRVTESTTVTTLLVGNDKVMVIHWRPQSGGIE